MSTITMLRTSRRAAIVVPFAFMVLLMLLSGTGVATGIDAVTKGSGGSPENGNQQSAPSPICDASLTPATAAAAGFNVIEGTDGRDRLSGTNGRDAIFVGGANDNVKAAGGDDCVLAGGGNDYVSGGGGDDTIRGETGSDKLDGDGGDDTLDGGPGSFSYLVGGPGADTCISTADGLLAAECEAE